MDEFTDDDVYSVQVFKDPTGDWLRVFRNGAMAIGCLPVARLIENPQVRSVLEEMWSLSGHVPVGKPLPFAIFKPLLLLVSGTSAFCGARTDGGQRRRG